MDQNLQFLGGLILTHTAHTHSTGKRGGTEKGGRRFGGVTDSRLLQAKREGIHGLCRAGGDKSSSRQVS